MHSPKMNGKEVLIVRERLERAAPRKSLEHLSNADSKVHTCVREGFPSQLQSMGAAGYPEQHNSTFIPSHTGRCIRDRILLQG